MKDFDKTHTILSMQYAVSINEALFAGDTDQIFSLLADLLEVRGEKMSQEQFANYCQRGLFTTANN
ncbi:MAG: hypothetical protein OIF56_13625 [Cohaesibacter sp.]|nr:hypothetical protein [Cohaesibacter sp.]